MRTLPDTTTTLDEMTALLRAKHQGDHCIDDIERLELLVRRLGPDRAACIELSEAKDLLGITYADSVNWMIQNGYLRTCPASADTATVRLVDVLHERLVRESLMVFGGDDLTEEELRIMHEATPGTNPWERGETPPSP